MMDIGFVLRHGWSFQAASLDRLARALLNISPHVLTDDLGYWSDAPSLPKRTPTIAWIAVGHSYGFASLLQTDPTPWHAAIGIGAFLTFPHHGLAALQQAMQQEPQRAIRAFRRQCRLTQSLEIPEYHVVGNERLLDTLHALQHLHIDMLPAHTLFLHGAQDRIVTAPQHAVIHPDAGHNLGIDEVDWCIAAIERFIETTVRSIPG